MAFSSSDFGSSVLYAAYANFNYPALFEDKPNGNPPNGNPQNPYIIIKNVTTNPEFGFSAFAINNLGNILNSYYLDIMPYFFLRYACFDDLAEIKNVDVNFEQIKLPLKYFTSGDLFGLNTIIESVKNGKSLDDPKNWNFFNSFTNDGTVSKTDDFKLNAEAVFYNTLYKYFKDGYYQLQLKSAPQENYTVKGKLVTDKDGKDTYVTGSGEAPNYLDISVNSKQKIKNKVVLKAKAIRTSYSTTIQPPQQIVIKRSNEELLSSLAIQEENQFNFNPAKEYSMFTSTSLSNISLDLIINDLLKPAVLYFNVVHYILRSSVINHKFFIMNAKEDDIFSNNSKQATDVKNIYSNKSPGLRDLLKKFPLYLKELIVNLLNLVDPTEIGNVCDKMLDYFEENNSNLEGLYSRSDLKEILIKLNDMCFETYKRSDPKIIYQNTSGGNIGKVTVGANLIKILAPTEIQHSNDLILQKVYVYRDIEKPLNYDNIVQQSKLYKIIDLPKNKENITLNESVVLEDNIDVNKKYYYCFLSQREYDIYNEIFNLKSEKNKGTIPKDKKEIVQHFSSPTKVLELEMISTDNSTYLDFNFFIPEEKQVVKNKVNFNNKIRISPSDDQKNSFDINKGLTGEFVTKPGLVDFWSNRTQLVPSNDYNTGQTLKLRITSPKTKRKIDVNVRHFVLDYYNLGNVDKKTTYYDIDVFRGGRKYYEVYSALKPEVKFNFDYPNKSKETKQSIEAQKPLQYKILGYKDIQIDDNFIYNLKDVSMSLEFKDPNVPPIKDYFQGWQVDSFGGDKKQLLFTYKDPKEEGNKKYSFPNLIGKEQYNKIFYQQILFDKFGFKLSSSWEFQADNKIVEYNLISQGPDQINEGDTKLFTLKVNNYPPGKDKEIRWRVVGVNNSSPLNDFKFVEGKLTINDKISEYIIQLPADQNILKTDNTDKTYKLIINKNFDHSNLKLQTDDIFLESKPFKVLDTSKAPLIFGEIIGKNSINEGELIEYSIQIKNRSKDDKFYWNLSFPFNISSLNDFETPKTSLIDLVFDKNDVAKIQIKAKEDASFAEGDEAFQLSVVQAGKGEVKSLSIGIKDTSVKQFKEVPDKSLPGSFENPFNPKQYKDNLSSLLNEFNSVFFIDPDDHAIKKASFITQGKQRVEGSKTFVVDSGILGSKINPFPSFNSIVVDGFSTENSNYKKFETTRTKNEGYNNLYYVDNSATINNLSKNTPEFKKLFKANFKDGAFQSSNSVDDVIYNRIEQYVETARNAITGIITNTTVTKNVSYKSVLPSSVENMCNDGKCVTTTKTSLKPADGANVSFTSQEIASPWHGIVTGSSATGTVKVWGNNSTGYSSDSDWAAAAVHAGLIKPGEKALISFESLGNNLDFVSSSNANITTQNWLQKKQNLKLYNGYKIKLVRKLNA